MKLSTYPVHRHSHIAFAALLTLAAIGCASPGPPRAPSLKLPRLVKDLTAQRSGNEVQLHWTTPDKTTDDLDIKGSITAEICRVAAATVHSVAPVCAPVKTLSVQPGPSQTTEILPSTLTSDPAELIVYRVRILNSSGHAAGLSNEAFAAAGAAPPPVEQLRITPVPTGAMLEWQPRDTVVATVALDRLIHDALAHVEKSHKKSESPLKTKPKNQPKPQPKKQPEAKPADENPATKSLFAAPSEPIELKLQTPKQDTDPGGTIDRTALRGETYDYTAQRVRTVVIAGHTLEIRSEASPVTVVHMRDTFPPRTPTGLAAISADHSIDLSWEPDTDSDLAGYNVYRQELSSAGTLSGKVLHLNATPVVGPAYSDLTAIPGRRYAYRVTAVDSTGNESAPCADVQETLREP
jgi:hypothetical protein